MEDVSKVSIKVEVQLRILFYSELNKSKRVNLALGTDSNPGTTLKVVETVDDYGNPGMVRIGNTIDFVQR